MKRTQWIAMIVTLIYFFCHTMCIAQAETSELVVAAKEKMAAIPDISVITDPDSDEYKIALDAAWDAVYALAECPDAQRLSIEGSPAVFDTLVTLLMMPLNTENAPTTIPTAEDFWEQYDWLNHYIEVDNNLPSSFFTLLTYASNNGESGQNQYYNSQDIYRGVELRINAYISTLSQEQKTALYEEMEQRYEHPEVLEDRASFAKEMALYPDHFTAENILDYAPEFDYLCIMMDYDHFDKTLLNSDDLEKFTTLEQEYQVVMGIHKDAVTKILEDKISTVCDLYKVRAASQLYLNLVEKDICNDLQDDIYALQKIYGYDYRYELKNERQFYFYHRAVYGQSYGDYRHEYGDSNSDGEIDARDALLVLQASVGKADLDYTATYSSDTDGDYVVNAKDALYILQYAVDKIFWFPVEESNW